MTRNVRIILLAAIVEYALWYLMVNHTWGLLDKPKNTPLSWALFGDAVTYALNATFLTVGAMILCYYSGKALYPLAVCANRVVGDLDKGVIKANTFSSALILSAAEFALFVILLPAKILLHVVASTIHWAIKEDR